MKNVKLDRQVFVFAIFYPIRLKNDDVSVNGFSLFSIQLATCFIIVLTSLEIICRSQGHKHANPPKNEGKVLFQVCHIIKIPLNGLTYNPDEHFTRFSHFSSPFQGSEKYVQNS